MSRPDPDVDQNLSSDPLNRKGFSPRLQRKIEQSAERTERTRRRTKPFLMLAGAVALLAVVLIFPWKTLNFQNNAASGPLHTTEPMAQTAVAPPPPVSTALLIGLRTEHVEKNPKRVLSSTTYSSYRTLLIAPIRGQLQTTAEGPGILMPYKHNFWKIDSLTHKTPTDEFHYLVTHPADQKAKPETFTDKTDEEMHHVETLLFAGNEYVSVEETEEVWRGNAPAQFKRIWVRAVPQMTEARTLDFSAGRADTRHVSIQDVFGAGTQGIIDDLAGNIKGSLPPAELNGESWTIARNPGQWVAKAAETFRFSNHHAEGYSLVGFPKPLPEKVVSHDTLCCAWSNIQSNWPEATDALTSPMNDVTVIVKPGKLEFYPFGLLNNREPLYTVELQPGEQLVMAQWATDHYVQDWIDRVGKHLAQDSVHDVNVDEAE